MTDSRGIDSSSVPLLALAIVNHLRQGHCIRTQNLPSPAFFTDYIFQSLNQTSDLHLMGNYKHKFTHTETLCVHNMHGGQMLLIGYLDLQQLLFQLGVGGAATNKSQDRRMRSTTGPSSNAYRHELLRGTRDWMQVLSFKEV